MMKIRFFIFLILGIFLTGIVLQPPLVFSHTIYPTPEEFYNSSDLIVSGKIISYDDSQQDRRYVVEVKEYVKKPENYDESKTINVFGCNPHPTSGSAIGGCQTFEKDRDVFFGISQNSDGKLSASYGFVIENQNCTGEQLVQTVNRVTTISVLQNNKSSPLFTGTKTDIVYSFVNSDLFSKNFTAQFKLNHGFPASENNTFYETKQVLVPECTSPFSVSASFIPTESGLYNASVTRENNSTLYIGGFSITDQNPSPLKQFRSGIEPKNILCRENLELIFKYDNSLACVKSETKIKLIERGYTIRNELSINNTGVHLQNSIVNILNDSSNPESQVQLDPKTITVILGINNTVTWINEDSTPHTLVSNENSTWQTRIILPDKKSSVIFNHTGIYEYHGEPCPWITGKVIVLENKNPEPTKTLPPEPPFEKQDPITKIAVMFGNQLSNKLVPVIFTEVTNHAENLDRITVWNFELIGHSGDDIRKTWDTLPNDKRIWYDITDGDTGLDTVNHTLMPENYVIPSDLRLYKMDCGLFQTVTGESAHPTSFPIKNNTRSIFAKNSQMGIYPDSNGEYSFEFASIFEHYVRFPEDSVKIISQDTKECKLAQSVDASDGKHTKGYYTKMTFRFL